MCKILQLLPKANSPAQIHVMSAYHSTVENATYVKVVHKKHKQATFKVIKQLTLTQGKLFLLIKHVCLVLR